MRANITAGPRTILGFAQDEKTSVVYGMLAAAAEKGAASMILPLHEIGNSIAHNIRKLAARSARISVME